MGKPVKNWRSNFDETPIFGDIVDEDLRYYGPRAVWRDLTRKDLGQKKAIFSGVIDFGYNPDELQAISSGLGGKKIAPLSISGVSEEPTIKIVISPPHVGGLTPLNSLPFPQYRLALTVDLQAPDAASLIQTIESEWAARTLLQGRFICVTDGVTAKSGYRVKIDPKSCISEIFASAGKSDFLKAEAWKSVEAAVKNNGSTWIAYYGGAEDAEDEICAQATLIGLLIERCFVDRTLIRYDNGMTAIASQLREKSSMGEAEARVLVLSTPAKITTEIAF